MEHAEENMKSLLEKAKISNINLKELNVIKKHEDYFKLSIKYIIVVNCVAFCFIFGKYGYLIDSSKVRNN